MPQKFNFFRYTDALATNWERRKACKSKWNFPCGCDRCLDPTEFGSMSSGVTCCQCDSGTLLLDNKDEFWTCDSCKTESLHSEIWFSILDPLERSKRDCVSSTDENFIEQWLWTALKMLHSNHVWILDMEYRLLFIYSKKIKHIKHKRKPVLLRMIQLGLHLVEVMIAKKNLSNRLIDQMTIYQIKIPFYKHCLGTPPML